MEKKDFSLFDRFIGKLFIGFILLFVVVVLDYSNIINYDDLKAKLNNHTNILNVVKLINGSTGTLIPLDVREDELVSNEYLNYVNIENGIMINLNNSEAVENIKVGLVVSIKKINDKYKVIIKGADGIEYIYHDLETVDVKMYQYIKSKDIIGKASFNGTNNYFKLYCLSEGKYIDYYN